MSVLKWGQDGKRTYETGVSKGVIYQLSGGRYREGHVWDGLTAVNENPSGGEPTKLYTDNGVYIVLTSAEEYDFSIEGYKKPKGADECFGKPQIANGVRIGQQNSKPFGFTWQTKTGNDREGNDYSYKIHLVFKSYAAPVQENHSTVSNEIEPETISWDTSSIPILLDDEHKTAKMVIDAHQLKAAGLMNVLQSIEDLLYGTDNTDATFPTITKLFELFEIGKYLLDSSGNKILDSNGNPIESAVY